MPSHKGKQRKWQEAISALLQFPTIEAAANHLGVQPETLSRWRLNPEFYAEYMAARREVVSVAVGNIQKGTAVAAEVLLEIASNPQERGMTRVAAAAKILDTAFKGIEHEELRQRVEAMEAELAALRQGVQAAAQLPLLGGPQE